MNNSNDPFDLSGAVAVVTGGSSGIGLATVDLFLGRGAAVAFCGRDGPRLRSAEAGLRERHPAARLLAQPCDVLDADSVARFAAASQAALGDAAILVNNAGQGRVSTFADTTDAAWTDELHLKFFSVIRPTRAFLPQLEREAARRGDAAIVCANSLLAAQPEPHMVATSAARAGIRNLVRSLATEFAPQRVRVNAILIGLIESGQWRRRFDARDDKGQGWPAWTARLAQQKHIQMGRLGLPEEAARAIYFLASPLSTYTTGSHLDVSGGTLTMPEMKQITVGAAIAAFLEHCGVQAAFGVISIHNMPILDAFAERGKIRFVMARGEAGGTGMADAYARTTGQLGVCLTSTGTAAGNAAGAMVEALTAGTPLLHLTGQIETQYLDQNLSYIHEAPDQLTMLRAVSKAAFRVRSAATAISTLKLAVQTAMTAPAGPVSVEIPIDIQAALIDMPADLRPLPVAAKVPDAAALDAIAERLAKARRPLLWLGGGARQAGAAVARLLAMGFGVVTSTQGRGTVPEDDPRSLGAYNLHKPVEAFYQTCDALLVVGSRLRGNETLKYELKLPRPLLRIDADASADGRCYASDAFACGDAALALDALADRLEGRMKVDPAFIGDLQAARNTAERALLDGLGPYADLVSQLQRAAGRNFNWVRDVTVSNSTWGNRQLRVFEPTAGVHALGGGIGQGLAMGIGAAVGAAVTQSGRKTFCLSGDGGFILNLGELATAVQEKADVVFVLMNDQRYGVIQNIQDAQYGGRRVYVELHTPDYAQLCQSMALGHARVADMAELPAALDRAQGAGGPFILEIDMRAIGSFKTAFAGPPVKAVG